MSIMRTVLTVWCLCCLLASRAWSQQTAPTIQWQATYGGTLFDILHCLQQTSDGGYVLGGRSIAGMDGTKTSPNYRNYDYWLVRLDANGRQLWDRSFGGSMYDAIRSLRQTPDGGFLLAGFTESPPDGNKTAPYIGPRDFWVIKTDANGIKIWERTYGGTGGQTLHTMRATPDGGSILGGTSNSSASGNKTSPNYGWGSRDFWIVRIDANGNILWDRSFGTTGDDDLHSVEVTPDGGFIVGGTSPVGPSGNKTSDNYGGQDYWIIRLDANGNKLWEQSYGGWGVDDLYSAVPTTDGGFMLGGYSASPPSGTRVAQSYGGVDLWFIKVDANGNKIWDRSFGGDGHDGFMDSFTMHRTPDGGFVAGTATGGSSLNGNKTAPNWGGADMWVLRLDAAGNKLWDFSAGASDTDAVNALQMTSDGGFILGGQSYSDVGGNKTAPRIGGADFWVVKLGPPGAAGNTSPTVSEVPAQTLNKNTASPLLAILIGDAETAAAQLTLTATSSNPALITPAGLVLGGSGANRTLQITPAANQVGSATITLMVSDPTLSASRTFIVTVQETGTVTNVPLPDVPGTDIAYVTSVAPGLPRNDFSGLVGYRITVGAAPIRVTALGRFAYAGNTEPHVVKIVRASDGTDVASATVPMSGTPAGQWRFAALPNAVSLVAQGVYYVVSEERAGGDRFGDLNTIVQTTQVAVHNSGVYASAAPSFFSVGGSAQSYGPPNFRYQTGAGLPLPTVAFQEPASGASFTLPTNITLRASLSAGVTNVDFFKDGVFLGRDHHNPATFVWLNPAGGNYVLTARATDTNGSSAVSSAINVSVRTPSTGSGQAFIVSKVLGEVRNDFGGFVGMKLTVKSQSLTVKEIGRIVGPGNTGTHVVKFVKAADLADLPNGSVAINMAGGMVGEFKYEPLSTPVVLQANTPYYLVSQEISGGDRWHGVSATTLSTLNVAVVNSGVFMGSGYGWSLAGMAQHAYGPVDFKLDVNDALNLAPLAPSGGGVAVSCNPQLRAWTLRGRILINVKGVVGQVCVLEASNDLTQWVTIAEHTLERDEVSIVDVEAPLHRFRFYRLRPAE